MNTSNKCDEKITIDRHNSQQDENKVYWVWMNGGQVQIMYCWYSQKWSAIVNNSGRTL